MTTPHHDCDSTDYKPSVAAYKYHRYNGETQCEYARACASYYRHVLRGEKGEWPGWNPRRYEHDCDSTDYEPSQVAYYLHRKRGDPPAITLGLAHRIIGMF